MRKPFKIDQHISALNGNFNSKIGIMENFPPGDRERVENVIRDLNTINIKELRTVISWAEYQTPEGSLWYDWLIPKLAGQLHLLPCIVYTPASLGLEPNPASPPYDPRLFADFIDLFLKKYKHYFSYLELWSEPNNPSYYNSRLDPNFDRFVEMIEIAAYWAKQSGKKIVLGGMNPIDPAWLEKMAKRGLLNHIDVVGIHAFPFVYSNSWRGWETEIKAIEQVLNTYAPHTDIWISEAGYSSWKNDEQNQILHFIDAINAPVNRVYWSSLYDIKPAAPSSRNYQPDERKIHFGMKHNNGIPKLLFKALQNNKPFELEKNPFYAEPFYIKNEKKRGVLITGGAGFIGTNVADTLLSMGERVIIYDNLSRDGVENNLKWLKNKHHDVEIMIADVNDKHALKNAVDEAHHVFHFAAQVAVTSSLTHPLFDHQVNVGGTVALLETIRKSKHKPSLIYTSTNKVYGDLSGLNLTNNFSRYFPVDTRLNKYGISENYPLNFHSPYGCSKGAADQYVLDYARSFDLKNIVFRMSCIYGPHQFGTEDQGWVAHFMKQSMQNKQIILYGDGRQVRDILYIDDLVNAFLLARKNIENLAGEVFNIGGGPDNAVSLIELLGHMRNLDHLNIQTMHDEWRIGDQKYYVTDIRKFSQKTGWKPKTSYMEGLINLYSWLNQYQKENVKQESSLSI